MARRRKRGSGGIFQRANGKWTGQVTLASRGGRVRRSFTSTSKGDVEFWLREATRAVRAGDEPANARRLLVDLLEDWLAEISLSVRPNTARGYRIHVEKWIVPTIGDVPLVDLHVAHVRRLRDAMVRKGRAPGTVAGVMLTLRTALEQGVRGGALPRNVAIGVKAPRPAPRRVVMTDPAQARAIMAAFDGHRLGPLVTVAIGTGLRLGELLGLRWTDITGDLLRVTGSVRPVPRAEGKGYVVERVSETKTRRSHRTIQIPTIAIDALAEERRRQVEAGHVSQFVFVTAGRPRADGTHPDVTILDPKNTTISFQSQLAAAGLPPMRFHDLRHAYATLMLGAGVPLRVIQEALGHSSIATTAAVYAHVLPDLQRDAARRLDEALVEG